MRAFVLGGYGVYGSYAARLLAEDEHVTQVAIAGRDIEKARETAGQIGDGAVPVAVDGFDVPSLASALDGYDVLLNVTFNPLVIPAIKAAIEANVHYVDVSHGDVMVEARDYTAQARSAGITAIVGIGIQPGISNLMASRCAEQLDDVMQYQLGWPLMWLGNAWEILAPLTPGTNAASNLEHVSRFRSNLAWQLNTLAQRRSTGQDSVLEFAAGKWTDSDPAEDGMRYPQSDGSTVTRYPYGCSALFLPGALPFDHGRDRPVQVSISALPDQANDLIRDSARQVISEAVDAEAAADIVFDQLEQDPGKWLTVPADYRQPPAMWTAAVGVRGGRPARAISYLAPCTWESANNVPMTSLPLVAAALDVAHGLRPGGGVFWPEEILDARSIFDRVGRSLPESPGEGGLVGEIFTWLDGDGEAVRVSA